MWSTDGTPVAFTEGAGWAWYSVAADVSGPIKHIDRRLVERWKSWGV